ncbi:MAG: YicC/YloC family endoribonuclease [Spirochaetota bacterium]
MESMTGYSYIEKKTAQFSFSVEIKSLNSKFLEINTYLPKLLSKNENAITELVKNKFTRGKIFLTIEVFNWSENKASSINKDLIKKIYYDLKDIEKELKITNFFSGDIIFSFDDIIKKTKTVLSSASYEIIINTIKNAIDKNIKMRLLEGKIIKKDVQNSLNIIQNNLSGIKKKFKDVSKILFKKLKNNIETIAGRKIDDVRVYTELAVLVDKMDINEEIVRLNDHLKKCRLLIDSNEQIGKKLDFLAQEMFRETNTIASKANNAEISHIVVNIKNHIDKLREHSRNIT